MSAARQRAFNGRSTASGSRNAAYAAISVNWKKMRPDVYNVDESRDERLEWIGEFLGIKDLKSMSDLSDQQLGAVAGEMKRLTGHTSQTSRTSTTSPTTSSNVVTGDFGRPDVRDGGRPQIEKADAHTDSPTVFLASHEQVYTLDKLQTHLGWSQSDVFDFIKKRVLRGKARLSGSVPNFRRLTFRQATNATNILLHVAAHRDLKRSKPEGAKVSRVEINKYIPKLKAKLRIDQRGA